MLSYSYEVVQDSNPPLAWSVRELQRSRSDEEDIILWHHPEPTAALLSLFTKKNVYAEVPHEV